MPEGEDPEERPAWAVNFEKRLQQAGDATRLAETLYRDNYAQREEIRALKEKQPVAGAVVLSADDAAQLEAYRALGTPDALKTLATERQTFASEAATLKHDANLRRAAAAHGYKANVLKQIVGSLPIEMVDAKGDTPEQAYVTPEGGQRVLLTDYMAEQYADFLPSLQAEGAQPPEQRRTAYPAQGNGKAPGATRPVDTYIKSQYPGPVQKQ